MRIREDREFEGVIMESESFKKVTRNKILREEILKTYKEVYRSHRKVDVVPELKDDSVLLETGLDSLGFAILVFSLEEVLGFDPFVISKEAYYPRTFGEFVAFYFKNDPR